MQREFLTVKSNAIMKSLIYSRQKENYRHIGWLCRLNKMKTIFIVLFCIGVLWCLGNFSLGDQGKTNMRSLGGKLADASNLAKVRVSIEPKTKGIIMCAHEGIIPLAGSLIRELRCLGNLEVIELYHCNELSAESIKFFHSIDSNIKVIDICTTLVQRGVFTWNIADSFRSYWIKPLAIHQSKLQEIIFVDSDNIFLHDPVILRQNEGYLKTGTVFFYDRVINRDEYFNQQENHNSLLDFGTTQLLKAWLKRFDYNRFNITPGYSPSEHLLQSFAYREETCHEQDSSLVIIDKARADKAMDVLWHLITEERFETSFSLGDKEAFWLSYEFAHLPYFFSPWGSSVVSSFPNKDMENHPSTLCGSLAHYMPENTKESKLLYINGKALVDPVPFDLTNLRILRENLVFNMLPTHIVPRQKRKSTGDPEQGGRYVECMTNLGSEKAPYQLITNLWRRRNHFMAIYMNIVEPLKSCYMYNSTKY